MAGAPAAILDRKYKEHILVMPEQKAWKEPGFLMTMEYYTSPGLLTSELLLFQK